MLQQFAELARRRGDAAFADECTPRPARLREQHRSARLGRRLVSPRLLRRRHAAGLGRRTPNARSIRSRRAGRSSRAPARPGARAGIAMKAVDEPPGPPRRRAHPAARSALRHAAGSTPATSRATCPACARTAANTPTPRSGGHGVRAPMGDTDRAWELFAMINPISHGSNPRAAPGRTTRRALRRRRRRLRGRTPHGRGGWTWYTGSAGWMYRLIIESLLGLRLEGRRLAFAPRLPAAWHACEIEYRYGETLYRIGHPPELVGGRGIDVHVDGVAQAEARCCSSTTIRNTLSPLKCAAPASSPWRRRLRSRAAIDVPCDGRAHADLCPTTPTSTASGPAQTAVGFGAG